MLTFLYNKKTTHVKHKQATSANRLRSAKLRSRCTPTLACSGALLTSGVVSKATTRWSLRIRYYQFYYSVASSLIDMHLPPLLTRTIGRNTLWTLTSINGIWWKHNEVTAIDAISSAKRIITIRSRIGRPRRKQLTQRQKNGWIWVTLLEHLSTI